ncbi:RHS repeat-associated core domain-containing protein [Cysteiniphilum sp. QT6929]|uniref:RHS repeat-associated core domain-containing protein n=1 Tax=Cysteiniphilum sp. QT6929 TaxID=2975055 RepID=UPI0024B3734F|nr:RHS repeat-associated core domain-containing protein [Cysteiniphilum sp. QT6929]WHN66015.1 RHS repeat-associated core domain-containing protein [Cysteiniphilum sp. QT6929]
MNKLPIILVTIGIYLIALITTQISYAHTARLSISLYYVNDGKSNSLILIKPINGNASIAIQGTTDYQAYGMHPNTLNTNVATNFGYNSEYQDPSSDLLYLRARDYDAGTQRFITQDNANVWNKYNFADNNPIMNIDPSGHISLNTIGLLMTVVVSLASVPVTNGTSLMMLAETGASVSNILFGIGDIIHHRYYAAAGDFAMAIGGMIGVYSAQDSIFPLGRKALLSRQTRQLSVDEEADINIDNIDIHSEELNAAKVTRSSAGSNLLLGVGSGLKTYQDNDGNHFNLSDFARFTLINGATGFAGGRIYGWVSGRMGEANGMVKKIVYGALRTTLNGAVGMTGNMINSAISHDINWTNTAVNLAAAPLMGAYSGFSQTYLGNYPNSRLAKAMRFTYLNLKTPIFGALLSGDISEL